jgi:hypothetical protein
VQAVSKLFEPVFAWAAKRYQVRQRRSTAYPKSSMLTPRPTLPAVAQAAVGTELKKYGLRYDDLLDPLQSLVRRAGLHLERVPPLLTRCRRTWRRRCVDFRRMSWTCATSG